MTPKIREVPFPRDLNEIPVSPRIASLIREVPPKEWKDFFGFIRLSLANRIGSSPKDELQTLQGIIKGVDEIDSFFSKIISEKIANFH